MHIDTLTLLIAAGAVVAVSGVSFILNTVLRRNERYGRIWSIAFIARVAFSRSLEPSSFGRIVGTICQDTP